MSEQEEPQYQGIAKILVFAGFAVACLILSLWLVKMAPGFIKVVGFLAAIVSIYVGWSQLASLKKESPKEEEESK